MVTPNVANLDWIRHIHLFLGLTDDELRWVLERLQEYNYQDGEIILREGDPPDGLYFIREGFVEIFRGEDNRLAILERRDYFGEEALVLPSRHGRTASARALGRAQIYYLPLDDFKELVARFPQVKVFLRVVARSRRRARRRRPNWLAPNEFIYLYLGKHPARLIFDLALSVVLLSVGLFFLWLWSITHAHVVLLISLAGAASGILLALWQIIDWANDDYIVTNQRVVWIERVALIYESRTEAPLRTILSLNVVTTLEGRAFGYGNVVIRTWFGSFTLRYVGFADQIEAIIKEFWQRAREQSRRAERQAMAQMLKERLGLVPPKQEEEALKSRSAASKSSTPRWLGLLRAFRNLFAERIEDGPVITYRKHWIMLLRRLWWHTLLGVPMFLIGLITIIRIHILHQPHGTLSLPMGVALVTFGLILLGWAGYHFADWANDIYQLTADQVIDIERKPLGSEQKQSAPLESIQSLDHARKGLLGILLNFGDVRIRAGTATLVFRGVHRPDQVLQDIYRRMEERRSIKAAAEAQRERERMVEWLAIYHEMVQGSAKDAETEDEASSDAALPPTHSP